MSNVKVTAALLESAGWTEAQVDRYYKLLARKQAHGLTSLTVTDRRFYLSAVPACTQAQTVIDKSIRDGQTRRVSGKQSVETKLHYRWLQTDLNLRQLHEELLPGEESAFVIMQQEQLRALDLYQPVLDTIDTARRHKFNPVYVELFDLALAVGRSFSVDGDALLAGVKAEFAESWNSAWDQQRTSRPWSNTGVGLSGDDALAFRAEVRVMVEAYVRTLPSVAKTVAV
jgi:hypothetical protein